MEIHFSLINISCCNRNLEKGYAARVDPSTAHQTLVRQMNWLDRNMESLLQQAPAPTVRFIANNKEASTTTTSTAAATTPQQPVKQFIDATAKPISFTIVKQSTPIERSEASSSSSSSSPKPIVNHIVNEKKPVQIEKPKQVNTPVAVEQVSKKHYTSKELSIADKRRKHEFRQLQTRFCDTFKTVRYGNYVERLGKFNINSS